jgi:hypothetical protein
MSRVSRIRSVSSQRHKFDEAPVFVMRFNCRMGGGGI